MNNCVDARLIGKNNTTNWNTISGSDNTVISTLSAKRNPLCWGSDLNSQLNCAVVYKSGGWYQSVGGVAITPRHILACGHVRDNFINVTAKFLNDSGEIPVNQVVKTIVNTYQIAGQSPMTYQGETLDLRIWLLDSDLPSWVYKCPIATISPEFAIKLVNSPLSIPCINVTQGATIQFQKLGVLNGVYPYQPTSSLRSPFYHASYTGDSGTPTFVLINNKLYLQGVIVGVGGSIQDVWNTSKVEYINEMIRRVDALQGITTGYTVSAVDMSTLTF
jgi:hypothetical protein